MSKKDWLKDNLKKAEAIVFDFDNTLIDEDYSIKLRWQAVLEKYESELKIANFYNYFEEIFDSKGTSYKFHLDDTMKKVGLSMQFKNEIVKAFLRKKSLGEKVFSRVIETLVLIKSKGYKLAIFTNGLKDHQSVRLHKSGIEDYFDHIQYGDCSEKKPSRVGYEHLTKSLKLKNKNNFIMIGDNFDEDYTGAVSYGGSCILINKHNFNNIKSPVYKSIEDFYFELNTLI